MYQKRIRKDKMTHSKNKNGKVNNGKVNNGKVNDVKYFPFVSICTPTYNRRPFYEMTIACFNHQTYPKNRMEWIIIDDGTDKIEDLVCHIPQVKYFKYDHDQKMTLGRKRNLMHEKAKGSILVYMDDDDYYPPERISHAVETLQKHPTAKIVGSSEMYIYFKHIDKMFKFGPYGPNHSTAATFAFRKELLNETKYDDDMALAEERVFLKSYQIPLIQLESAKSILVFSHIHNSVDKVKILEDQKATPYVSESDKKLSDFVKEPRIHDFILNRIDGLLEKYEPGKPENKPEVMKQIRELTEKRETLQMEHQKNQQIDQMFKHIQTLTKENMELKDNNDKLKEQNTYLSKKMGEIIIAAQLQKKS